MKKFILPIFAAFAINAAAQVEFATPNAAELGLESATKDENNKVNNDKILDKGTVIAKSENLVVSTGDAEGTAPGAGHGWSAVTTHVAPYKYYQIGGVQVKADESTGVQGQANGNQPSPLEQPNDLGANLSFDASGSFFNIEVAKDGFLYVCNKMSGNKNYYVFAHMKREDGSFDEIISAPIAYSVYGFAADWANGGKVTDAPALLGNEDGIISYSVTPAEDTELIKSMYTGTSTIGTPISFFDGLATANFMGVMKFPVQAGLTYAVMARGSKMSLCAVAFSETEAEIALFAPAQEATEEKEAVEAKTLVLAEGAQGTEQTALKRVNKAAKMAAFKTVKNHQLVIDNGGKNYALDGKIVK